MRISNPRQVRLGEQMQVAFQGEPGAYSEAAALEHFGDQAVTLPQPAFEDVFAAVTAGTCDGGMIPIENSLAGSIHRNYDLLLQNALWIVGEHYLRVKHCLIALPGVEMKSIRRVISHPQALAQCDGYLRSLGVAIEPAYDTAGSLKLIRESNLTDTAAIASRRAAEVNAMHILAEGVEDNPLNYTRFLEISRQPCEAGEDSVSPKDGYKTSIVTILDNVPGSLFKALSIFAIMDINLSKIESRPLIGKPWDYLFYIDFLGSASDPKMARALDNLSVYSAMLRILGSYRAIS